ncbi:hypothetical protein NT6N_21370 [Oceaniferula spumae]|uniref:F5/8 type C domain-containing protein n=1 Tax=Oceaniferula spumae TaxID=2979115 RepID=A0AAT9FMF2_9BACT
MFVRFLAASLLSFQLSHAAPSRVDTFVHSLTEAKASNKPIAVFVHGSSWHPASRLFGEKIWRSETFSSSLKHPVILTNIEIKQGLDKEAAKAEEEKYKGWKSVTTYPAVQVYGSDGHLLKSYSGRELRILTTPESLADHLNHILAAAELRRTLLDELAKSRADNDPKQELVILTKLIDLSLNNEEKIVDQLKKVDPDDSSGWQARLSFRNWEFVRHISELIGKNETQQALTEIDRLLANPTYTPQQRCLIYGAKGRALVAEGNLNDAWNAFQQAYEADPKGANGIAMLRYGIRMAGIPLRESVPTDSALYGKDLGENLTRDYATFTLSSSNGDDPSQHASLFKGPFSGKGYAFHTASEKGAHIIIDLQATCQLKALQITNRNNNQERAATLTLWVSTDKENWTQVWSAEKSAPAWDILLDSSVSARFLKLGLNPETTDYLHLRGVNAYGTRPKS